jgi:hypothetical protein
LLGFELTQRCYEDNQQQLQHKLEQTRQRLAVLQQPLDAILQARAAVEARQVQGVVTGLIDSPYAAHHPTELPAMIEAWREQLARDPVLKWSSDPNATVFDHEPTPQRQSTIARSTTMMRIGKPCRLEIHTSLCLDDVHRSIAILITP